MRVPGPTTSAGLWIFLPSTTTRPAAIHASASRREQRPARAMRLAIRSWPGAADDPAPFGASAGGGDEGIEDLLVALADRIFRMPLDAEAIAVARGLDPLDHAVGGERIDDHALAHRLHRLVMGAVDLKLIGTADAMEQGALGDADAMARLRARIGLLMGERVADLVRDVLDQGAAENDVQQLLTAADAEHRHVAGERALGDLDLEGGALRLQLHRGMARRRTEQGGIDIEGPARHHQPVDAVEIGAGLLRLMGQQDGQASGPDHRLAIILAQRIPGQLGIAP